ncbi:MAG: hypothetical protein ACLPVY_12440 [Acidimicrobiia bacterium]
MNETQLDQLRDALHREAQHIHPVGLGADTVRRRGRRRRHRGRAVVAVGAATCVAGLGVSLIERDGGAPHSVVVGAASGAAVTPTLEFRVVDGTVANSTMHFTTAAGVTYELSTAPGVAPPGAQPGQAIYSTSDGEHWTTATQDQPWISDLAGNDGVLYAIGTAPGAAAGDVRYLVGTSHDGGAAWSDTNLPFDLSVPTATVSMSPASTVQIASGATGTVALLTEQFSPDLDALVAARSAGHPDVTTTMTNDGYDIVDLSGCAPGKQALASRTVKQALAGSTVEQAGSSRAFEQAGSSRVFKDAPKPLGAAVASPGDVAPLASKCTDPPVVGTISWSDLGLTGPGELTRQQMLVSTDGTHWTSTPPPNGGTVQELVADSDGFLVLANNTNPSLGTQAPSNETTLLQSTDARTWTTIETPPGLNVQAIAGDLIVGTDSSGAIQTSSDGGKTWNTTNVNALLPAGTPTESVTASDAGPLGFALLVTPDQKPNDQTPGHDDLLFSTDGIDWTTTDLAAVGEPSTGYPMQVTVGADHISIDYGLPGATPDGTMKITTLLATPKG